MKKTQAFTLVELLVVIAIISILAAIMFPVIGAVKARGRQTQCMNNVRQIATAAVASFDASRSFLPSRGSGVNDCFKNGVGAKLLLPYIRNMAEVFNCPANDGKNIVGDIAIPDTDATCEYILNPYLSTCGNANAGVPTAVRGVQGITDFTLAAYAWDNPYLPGKRWPHKDLFLCSFLDTHTTIMRVSTMGTMGTTNAFYARGHIFAMSGASAP